MSPRSWVPLELAAGQAHQLAQLLAAELRPQDELVIETYLLSGVVVASIRRGGSPGCGVVRARMTYRREAIETLGALWAQRAAADLTAQLQGQEQVA